MDSRVLRRALLIVTLFVVTIFIVILGMNGYLGSKGKSGATAITAKEEEAADKDGRIKGSDLNAWKYDETFFDPKLIGDGKYENMSAEGNAASDMPDKSIALSASSVEKDIRIRIMDSSGEPVKGQFFIVLIGGTEYKDEDRDGLIYVNNLSPGDYEVKLAAMEGYDVPSEPIKCSVKAKLEYKVISDISYLIKTEADIDALREDTGENDAGDSSAGTDAVRNEENAKFGIDVSKYNKEIDWNAVKESGVQFAIIRCGYRGSQSGSIIEDPYFRTNMEGAMAAGIPVGVYFFTQAINAVEAVEEASAVLSLTSKYKLDYPIFIDTEGAGGAGRADNLDVAARSLIVEGFCETIRNSGGKAGIYASKNWFNSRLDITKFNDSDVIWLAEYADSPSYGGKYSIWQYSSAGRINGIEGRVDMNISHLNTN